MAFRKSSEMVVLGSVSVGAAFIFRTSEVLGPAVGEPPYEGQQLTVVAFKPRLKNNVVVQETNGRYSLMPLEMVEKAVAVQRRTGMNDEDGQLPQPAAIEQVDGALFSGFQKDGMTTQQEEEQCETTMA